MYNTKLFSELKGQIIKSITKNRIDNFIIKTETKKYVLFHGQDCCEYVRLEKEFGNLDLVLNSPIILAEEDNPFDPDWYKDYGDSSHTWSKYRLETINGYYEMWFLGESNGYYAEDMRFEELN